MHTQTHMQTRTPTHMHVYAQTFLYTHIHTHIPTYVRIHIHTHRPHRCPIMYVCTYAQNTHPLPTQCTWKKRLCCPVSGSLCFVTTVKRDQAGTDHYTPPTQHWLRSALTTNITKLHTCTYDVHGSYHPWIQYCVHGNHNFTSTLLCPWQPLLHQYTIVPMATIFVSMAASHAKCVPSNHNNHFHSPL